MDYMQVIDPGNCIGLSVRSGQPANAFSNTHVKYT